MEMIGARRGNCYSGRLISICVGCQIKNFVKLEFGDSELEKGSLSGSPHRSQLRTELIPLGIRVGSGQPCLAWNKIFEWELDLHCQNFVWGKMLQLQSNTEIKM